MELAFPDNMYVSSSIEAASYISSVSVIVIVSMFLIAMEDVSQNHTF